MRCTAECLDGRCPWRHRSTVCCDSESKFEGTRRRNSTVRVCASEGGDGRGASLTRCWRHSVRLLAQYKSSGVTEPVPLEFCTPSAQQRRDENFEMARGYVSWAGGTHRLDVGLRARTDSLARLGCVETRRPTATVGISDQQPELGHAAHGVPRALREAG